MQKAAFSRLVVLGFVLNTCSHSWADSFDITTFSVPGAQFTSANGVNDSGQIVGAYQINTTSSINANGYLLSGGEFTTIDPGLFTTVYGINNAGEIVGMFSGPGLQGFLLQNGDDMSFQFGTNTALRGISDQGTIVGSYVSMGFRHGFLFDASGLTNLDPPGTGSESFNYAVGVNDRGEILVTSMFPQEAYLYQNGVFLPIQFPGADETEVGGINNNGVIAGNFMLDGESFGFLLNNGTYTAIDVPGVISGINDSGEIVGTIKTDTGTLGFMATPVPEPGSGGLSVGVAMVLGLVRLAWRSPRRSLPGDQT